MGQSTLRQVLKEQPKEVQQRKRLGGLQGRGGFCPGPEKICRLCLVGMEVDCRVRMPWKQRHAGSRVQNTCPETNGNGGWGSPQGLHVCTAHTEAT